MTYRIVRRTALPCVALLVASVAWGSASLATAARSVDTAGVLANQAGRPAGFAVIEMHTLLEPTPIRTRKMHMVRPDLMHFPISYDVYC